MKLNYNLTDLTSGERLWLTRRVRGWSQPEAARRFGVGRTALSLAENDREPLPIALRLTLRVDVPALLALARRRYGYGLRGTAGIVGVSHRTLLAWERTADARLLQFWTYRKFVGFR